jgi:curli biogenesis system outer membrane secretion channel CsgG
MKDEDVHNLLGGFAAGILTDRERELLFTAALKDQKLFDALADEEALRELLADPVSRRQLLESIEPVRPGAWERLTGWMRRPAYLIIAGSVVAALVVTVALRREKAPPIEIAKTETRSGAVSPLANRTEAQPAARPMTAAPTPAERDRAAMPSTAPSTASPPARMKVAVLDFNSPALPAKDTGVGKEASDLLTKKLDSSGYAVIDRKQVNQALQDQNLTTRELDASSAASVGRSLGADAVIVGSVQPAPQAAKSEAVQKAVGAAGGFRAQEPSQNAPPSPGVEITATAINSQTADNLAVASSQSGQSQDGSLAGAVNQVALSLGRQIQQKSKAKIAGTVTGVTAKSLTLDVGAKAGVRVGDKLDVRRDSKPIGRVVITSVKDSLSVGEFQGYGGAKVGDTVASQ